MAADPMWVARCRDWTSRRYPTEGQAQQKAKDIAHHGACPLDHEIVMVIRNDEGTWRDPNGARVN